MNDFVTDGYYRQIQKQGTEIESLREQLAECERLHKSAVSELQKSFIREERAAKEMKRREARGNKPRTTPQVGWDVLRQQLAVMDRRATDYAALNDKQAGMLSECQRERDEVKTYWFDDADPSETKYADEYALAKLGADKTEEWMTNPTPVAWLVKYKEITSASVRLSVVASLEPYIPAMLPNDVLEYDLISADELFTAAQLNQARADALREAAEMFQERYGYNSVIKLKLRRMATEIEGEK